MSTIAQKLCDEIVDPVLKASSIEFARKSKNNNLMYNCPSRQNGKTTRAVIVEKKKTVNKLVPNESGASRTIINKLKSKETILKKNFVDTAINTQITGPLRCDNNCVTLVRKRDSRCTCKCGQKRLNFKATAKQIQTFDPKKYIFVDKACAQCVETASCGTQFLSKQSSMIKPKSSSKTKVKIDTKNQNPVTAVQESAAARHLTQREKCRDHYQKPSSSFARSPNLNYMGARRWALSQYPARGPDF